MRVVQCSNTHMEACHWIYAYIQIIFGWISCLALWKGCTSGGPSLDLWLLSSHIWSGSPVWGVADRQANHHLDFNLESYTISFLLRCFCINQCCERDAIRDAHPLIDNDSQVIYDLDLIFGEVVNIQANRHIWISSLSFILWALYSCFCTKQWNEKDAQLEAHPWIYRYIEVIYGSDLMFGVVNIQAKYRLDFILKLHTIIFLLHCFCFKECCGKLCASRKVFFEGSIQCNEELSRLPFFMKYKKSRNESGSYILYSLWMALHIAGTIMLFDVCNSKFGL